MALLELARGESGVTGGRQEHSQLPIAPSRHPRDPGDGCIRGAFVRDIHTCGQVGTAPVAGECVLAPPFRV